METFMAKLNEALSTSEVPLEGILSLLPFARSILLIVGIAALSYAIFSFRRSKSWIFGIACMILYFALGIVSGISSLLPFILFFTGGLFLLLELAVPGFGIAGISGIVLVVSSLIFSMSGGLQAIVTLLVAALIVVLIAKKLIQEGGTIPLFNRLISTEEEKQKALVPFEVGERGKAVSALRPSGVGEFDGKRMTVYSEGGFVERGKSIEITEIRGRSAYVKEV